MNHSPHRQFFRAAAWWLCVLLAALALPGNTPAQPTGPQRWLLVFDLSATMKSRLPATEDVLKTFFATSAGGRLHEGDFIAVWTYDQKLHPGQFPMITWNPAEATSVRTNLTAFLDARRFTGEARLAALQPALGEVITNSERLTVIIFCDGASEMSSTPYDSGINQNFLDGRTERGKSRQPFVVLIRTLSGKFIGCTVNYPPGAINIPLFLPPAPPTNNPPSRPPRVITPVKPPPVVVPDLIIIGTNVGAVTKPVPTKISPVEKPVPVAPPKIIVEPLTNPAAVLVVTNPVHPVVVTAPIIEVLPPKPVLPASNRPVKEISSNAVAMSSPLATNPVTVPPPAKIETVVAAPVTNPAPATVTGGSPRPGLLVFAGVGLLTAVGVLALRWRARASRRSQSSLITTSMQDDRRKK